MPADDRRAIAEAISPLRAVMMAPADVSWVQEPSLHLTMKFLGEVNGDRADALVAALAPVAGAHRAFELEVDGAGAFPHWRAPRVMWVGVAHSPKLELLYHEVEGACVALGHELEGRPFSPHVTVARVRKPLAASIARALGNAARAVTYHSSVPVRSVDVMSSTLAAGGSRYDVVSVLPLKE
ncbi:MAG: RNA 2',3'-cyclic phosphodiesterase [Gemmatimonadaceae bacterium]